MTKTIAVLGVLAWAAVAWPQEAGAGAVGSNPATAPAGPLPGCDAPATERKAGEREPRQAPPNANCDLPESKDPADPFIDNSIQGLTDGAAGSKLEPRQDVDNPDPDHDRGLH